MILHTFKWIQSRYHQFLFNPINSKNWQQSQKYLISKPKKLLINYQWDNNQLLVLVFIRMIWSHNETIQGQIKVKAWKVLNNKMPIIHILKFHLMRDKAKFQKNQINSLMMNFKSKTVTRCKLQKWNFIICWLNLNKTKKIQWCCKSKRISINLNEKFIKFKMNIYPIKNKSFKYQLKMNKWKNQWEN